MRQIGEIEREADARRFAAYLLTQGISAQAERGGAGWAIWVRDENLVDVAREALEDFRHRPEDSRYQGAEREADSIRRDEAKRREQAQKNVVEMGGKWGRGGSRRRPLTLVVIGVCVVISLVTNMGANVTDTPMRKLLFADRVRLRNLQGPTISWKDMAHDVLQGEVWRVFTPTLVHYGPWHLAFNMIMFYQLGSVIEERRGTWRLALMILAIGVISTLVQSLAPLSWGGSPLAAGFSGVVFGLFGFVWLASVFSPEFGMHLNPNAKIILMIWLFMGISGVLEHFGMHVANWSHGIGFLVGAAIGYLPKVTRTIRSD